MKKRKIFQKISSKVNFYKKLEIPILQNAYNRLHGFLEENERLADRGEFSILNTTGVNLLAQSSSRLLLNKSVFSNRTLLMESMNEGINILEELNNEKNKLISNDNMMELTRKLLISLNKENL